VLLGLRLPWCALALAQRRGGRANPNPNVGMAGGLAGVNPNCLGTTWGAGPVSYGLTIIPLRMANPNPNIGGGGMMAVVWAGRARGLQPWL
jgi:hypothetical protein